MSDDKQLDLIIADLEEFTRGEIVALALNVNANLRSNPPLGTPIDTGWASANWVMSVGQPFNDPQADSVKSPNAAQVIARRAIAQQSENEVLSWRLDKGPIFTTNNVPYIQPLNSGHSKQSPTGFVQAAIEKAVRQTYSRAREYRQFNERAAVGRASKARPVQ